MVGGCYQGLDDVDAHGPGADHPGEAGIDAQCTEGAAARLSPLRRMTDIQYRNTIEDLLHGTVDPSASFPATLGSTPFDSYPEANPVTQLGAEGILLAAEDVAAQAVENLGTLLPCASIGDDACADTFIDSFGPRAFRRPLHPDERELLRSLFDASVTETGFDDAIGRVIAATLQMPQFLYLVEAGEPTDEEGVVRLTDWEVASRLSYLLWDTMPDEALVEAVEQGRLCTLAEVEAQARRLLADDRAAPVIARFARQWLEVDTAAITNKDPEHFPEYDQTLAAAMEQEFDHFVTTAFRSGEGSLATLLTGRETMVNAPLAELYGVDTGSTGPDDWRTVSLPAEQRAGVLTLPAVLASNSGTNSTSAILRGKMLRTQALCQPIPPPPMNLEIPEFPQDASEREKSDVLMSEPSCAGCHTLINPLGLAFESYDALGRHRTQDDWGNPIDPAGEIVGGPSDLVGSFSGAPQFAEMVASSDAAAECMTVQWVRYASGRSETSDDSCMADSLTESFIASGYDLQQLLVAFTQTEGFRFRRLQDDQ